MKFTLHILFITLFLFKSLNGISQDKKDTVLVYQPTFADTIYTPKDSNKIIKTSLSIVSVKRKSGLIATLGIAGFSSAMVGMWGLSDNKTRGGLVAGGNIVAYGGAMIGLYSLWYKKYPQSKFHFFNDNQEWLQVDKVSHAYGAYM